jgi:hypothetical protein
LNESRIEVEGKPPGTGVADGVGEAPGVDVEGFVAVGVTLGVTPGGVAVGTVGVGVAPGSPKASDRTHCGSDPFGGTLWFPSCKVPSQACGPSSVRIVPEPFDIE